MTTCATCEHTADERIKYQYKHASANRARIRCAMANEGQTHDCNRVGPARWRSMVACGRPRGLRRIPCVKPRRDSQREITRDARTSRTSWTGEGRGGGMPTTIRHSHDTMACCFAYPRPRGACGAAGACRLMAGSWAGGAGKPATLTSRSARRVRPAAKMLMMSLVQSCDPSASWSRDV